VLGDDVSGCAAGERCEVHCTDAVTSLVPPDWPPVTLTPLPVQTLALAHLASADGVARIAVEPLPGAPPPTSASAVY
jgi:hypothetical protein